ncbi:hypothetical protein [Clostridium baratii]|uniref:hypothetical protein n=1 Tax=Clostridium baratii TaxID=1561 RepID=UPI0030D1D492
MKKKLIAMAICAATVSTSLLSGVTAFAAGQTGTADVPVTYDSSKTIIDPDNDLTPDFQVVIPAAINFKSTNEPVDTTVSIKDGADKTQDYTGNKNVLVKVASQNEFKVIYDGEKLDYSLAYGPQALTGAGEHEIATLNSSKKSEKGSATLKGIATKSGLYTDTLTYSVQAQ